MHDFIVQCAQWLVQTSFAEATVNSDYLFPLLESIHVIGVGLVIGTISLVDLRLLGWAWTRRSVRDVAGHILPIAWSGFAIALLSGSLMFVANATSYIENPFFLSKLVVLSVAGLNMLVFHRLTWRSIETWDTAHRPPVAARSAGAVSLSCWIVVVFLGRWVGFV